MFTLCRFLVRMPPALLVLVLVFGLAACKPAAETLRGSAVELSAIRSDGERTFTVGDVLSWAQLDDYLRDQTLKLETGQADGKALLGRLVMLENGAETADFLKAHGCARISGPTGVRKLPSALEVEAELTGKDGAKLVLILKSDGTPQGEG